MNSIAVGAMASVLVALATLTVRSRTALSHFTRVEYCSLCGIEKTSREICIADRRILKSTSHFDTPVSRIFGKARCGHMFFSIRERMLHLSVNSTPRFVRWERGRGYATEIFAQPSFLAALAKIHAKSPEASELIWSRTVAHVSHQRAAPLAQIREALARNDVEQLRSFLETNRHFRPVRANPERWFNSFKQPFSDRLQSAELGNN